ncbi:MAG TPA: hypothetical protein PKW33_10060 [Anaerolineaceae bacterium]|nr:hypothetical protein [Anaerolineaceae bacterium]HPN51919.1 hypothetical protein [Anaerolineaceae bacterium]
MEPQKEPVTHIDYCQYPLVGQINDTLTNQAAHTEKFSHDWHTRPSSSGKSDMEWHRAAVPQSKHCQEPDRLRQVGAASP